MDDNKPDLGFGIPSLDKLFGADRMVMMPTQQPSRPTSICLVGPAGTGKSILALHFASSYRADHSDGPKLVYISTDFSHSKAVRVWEEFSLDDPASRKNPFAADGDPAIFTASKGSAEITLLHCPAEHLSYTSAPQEGEDGDLIEWKSKADYLWKRDDRREILFIDLNSSRSGDEWDFVNRLLSVLPPPEASSPAHLLVIDAVEGLEMFVGSRDSHGEERTRRSRVTQLLRTAADKAHLFFVVEDDGGQAVPPEEFLTDFVLRTHLTHTRGYDRRAIQVVKARAQWHYRGQHMYVIRDGDGTRIPLGNEHEFNPDDPKVSKDDGRSIGYVHVMHSVHGLYRDAMRQEYSSDPAGDSGLKSETDVSAAASDVAKEGNAEQHTEATPPRWIGFGIPFLDELLGVNPNGESMDPSSQGLPQGNVTALIGDQGTHRRRLARAYLSGCFDPKQLQGIGVLLSLSSYHPDDLAKKILLHRGVSRQQLGVGAYRDDIQEIRKRLVYRKLELHDISSAVFIHIVKSSVVEAKRRMRALELYKAPSRTDSQPEGGVGGIANADSRRIRVVINDWSTLAATYPDLASDPLVLPFVIDYLRSEGVTTLLIDNQAGGPRTLPVEKQHRELRALTQHQIYTWRVPFFGEERIAISAVPALSDEFLVHTRELRRSARRDDETLWVDPHFEIYSGLETSDPHPVPLQLRMYAKTEAFERYAEFLRVLFREPFVPREGQSLVVCNGSEEYEDLRLFSHVQSDSRLDHTLVFEVDEFWMQRSGRTELMDLKRYLQAVTDDRDSSMHEGRPRSSEASDKLPTFNDPFYQFRGMVNGKTRNDEPTRYRHEYFTRRGYDWKRYVDEDRIPLDRVPFMWDFGFVMLDDRAWTLAKDVRIGKCNRTTVSSIRNSLEHNSGDERTSWRDFLEACKIVAENFTRPGETAPAPFDLDMRATEALSCVVLEMWFSEIQRKSEDVLVPYRTRNPWPKNSSAKRMDLIELIEEYKNELFRVFLLLGEVFDGFQFQKNPGGELIPRPAGANSVAARHWYSTATSFSAGSELAQWTPVRLPGHYSVRGDWYLAVAKGSRSERVAWHAIDLLSGQRENFRRLQMGLGLPTRDYLPVAEPAKPSDQSGKFATALKPGRLRHAGRFGKTGALEFPSLAKEQQRL